MSGKERTADDWEWSRRVMTDPELSPTERNVAFVLQAHARKGDRRAWPSVTTLMLLTGLSDRSVQKSLKHLVKVGWLSVDEKPGKTSDYALLFDRRFQDVPSFDERRAEVRERAKNLRTSPPKNVRGEAEQGGEDISGEVRRNVGGGPKNVRGTPEEFSDEPLQVTPPSNPSNEPNSLASLESADKGKPKPAKQSRGCRIPEDWQPSSDGIQILLGKGFSEADVEDEAANFRDHWLAESGQKGIKRDWQATWRKWCRSDYCRPKGDQRNGTTTDGFLAALGKRAGPAPNGFLAGLDRVVPGNGSSSLVKVGQELVAEAREQDRRRREQGPVIDAFFQEDPE
ncbi:MAG: helix-turn-helix domain-containing protein [Kiloniellales bacterium]